MKLIMVLDLFIQEILLIKLNNNKTNLIIVITMLNLFLIKVITTEINTMGGMPKGNNNKTEKKRPTVKFTLIDKNSE